MKQHRPPSVIPAIVLFIVLLVVLKLLIGGAVCSDGWASPSIGKAGACSHHGGVRRWPSTLAFLISVAAGVAFHFMRMQRYEERRKTKVKSIARPFKNYESQRAGRNGVSRQTPASNNASFVDVAHKPTCPNCNAPMILRTVKTGRNIGDQFWGCSRFLQCKGARAHD